MDVRLTEIGANLSNSVVGLQKTLSSSFGNHYELVKIIVNNVFGLCAHFGKDDGLKRKTFQFNYVLPSNILKYNNHMKWDK